MVKLLAFSPRGHEFDPRLLPFMCDFKLRSTPPCDLVVSRDIKKTHSFELSLASMALAFVKCVFV